MFLFTKIWECRILHKKELEGTYSHLGYKQIGIPVKNLLNADEPKTGAATGGRAGGGLIESWDITVTPGLTPYKMQVEVLELTEFTKQKKYLSRVKLM